MMKTIRCCNKECEAACLQLVLILGRTRVHTQHRCRSGWSESGPPGPVPAPRRATGTLSVGSRNNRRNRNWLSLALWQSCQRLGHDDYRQSSTYYAAATARRWPRAGRGPGASAWPRSHRALKPGLRPGPRAIAVRRPRRAGDACRRNGA